MATALTAVKLTAQGAANGAGTVSTIAGPIGAVANGRTQATAVIPGITFTVAITVAGTVASVTPTVTLSATGYDISIANISSAGTGTGTASQIIAGVNADPVVGKLIQMALFGADTGAGVQAAAVGKTSSSTGAVVPSATLVPVDTLHAADVTGNTLVNTGQESVFVNNTAATAAAVRFDGTNPHTGVAITRTVVVDVSKTAIAGPFPTDTWGTSLTITALDTGVKFCVFSLVSPLSANNTVSMILAAARAVRDNYDATGNANKGTHLEAMVMKSLARRASVAYKRLVGPTPQGMGTFPYATSQHDRP